MERQEFEQELWRRVEIEQLIGYSFAKRNNLTQSAWILEHYPDTPNTPVYETPANEPPIDINEKFGWHNDKSWT